MKARRALPICLALLMTASLGACNRGPDPKDQIERDLKSASMPDVNVDYDRSNKVVHLTGAVDNSAEKSRAEEIAQRAVGTTGRVANELTVKGVNILRTLQAKIREIKRTWHRETAALHEQIRDLKQALDAATIDTI